MAARHAAARPGHGGTLTAVEAPPGGAVEAGAAEGTSAGTSSRDRRAAVAAFVAVLVAGAALRALVLTSSLGLDNSDEAQTGIQALELLRGHAWVFVPGTAYGGNAEAWLDAPFAWAFGASPLRTKILTSLLWLAAAGMSAWSLRTRGWRPALAAASMIWLPAGALVLLSTQSYPGYPAGLLAACAAIALATPAVDGATLSPGRALLLGLAAAFAVWMHPLYLLAAGALTAAAAFRHIRRPRTLLALGLGAGVGIAGPVVHNLRNGWPSLQQPVVPTFSYTERVRLWLVDLFPRATGQKLLDSWVADGASRAVAVALFVVVLIAIALVLWRGRPAARVAAGALLAAPFTLTIFSNSQYTLDGRYASMVLPLAAVVVGEALAVAPRRPLAGARPALLLGAWLTLAALVPLLTLPDHRKEQPDDPLTTAQHNGVARVGPLVELLERRGIEAVRADFWVAYRIAYGSGEDVVASPVTPFNKFRRYETEVRAAEAAGTAALVLFSVQVRDFDSGALGNDTLVSFGSYERQVVGPWTVFLPPRTGGT